MILFLGKFILKPQLKMPVAYHHCARVSARATGTKPKDPYLSPSIIASIFHFLIGTLALSNLLVDRDSAFDRSR